ncbi:MAG: DUF58 domain-containing protein [Planctomycetota bacterium]
MDRTSVSRELARFRLAPPTRLPHGQVGELRTRGLGSSSEFHELREYRLGDDIRRIDWRSSMRTDRWMLRLYREEIEPRLDVIVDASLSMGAFAVKASRLRELVALLKGLATRDGFRARARRFADGGPDDAEGDFDLDGRLDLAEGLRRAPVSGAGRPWRIVLSDFLFETDPRQLVTSLASGGSRLSLLQILTARELRPDLHGFYRLVDAESGTEKMTAIGPQEIRRYRERLQRWNAELADVARAHGAQYLLLEADRPLGELARDVLLPAGILVPAGACR